MKVLRKYSLIIAFFCLLVLSFIDLPLTLMLFSALLIGILGRFLIGAAYLDKKRAHIFVLGVLISNIALLIYNHFQNFIPFWDYAGYYRESLFASKAMYSSLPEFLKSLYNSMLFDDYTKLPTLFTGPLIHLFSGQYSTYILICYNIFIVPFLYIMSVTIYKIKPQLTFLVFLFPPFLNPVLRGYVDSIGLIFVSFWLYVVLNEDLTRLNIKKALIFGLLNTIFVFTRRWYIFFLIAAFISVFITYCIKIFITKKQGFKNVFLNLLISGGTTLLIVAVFFFPYLKRLFSNSFSDTYSAYQFGNFIWNIKYFIKYYGIIAFAFVLLGAIAGTINKKTRYFSIFLILHCVIEFVLFNSVQTISYHHQYLFAAEVFLLIIIGAQGIKSKAYSHILTLVLAFSLIYTYVPFTMPKPIEYVLTSKRFEPKTMNREPLYRLCDRLNELTEEGEYSYILASSEVLNDDILRNSRLPDEENAVNNFFGTAHVDKRDGFPNVLLVSKYIVVAEPVQVHLGEENQQIVAFFAREILDGTYTQNLERIDTIKINDEVSAHIYERKSGYSIEFLNRAKTHFETMYPEHPNLHNVDFVYSQN